MRIPGREDPAMPDEPAQLGVAVTVKAAARVGAVRGTSEAVTLEAQGDDVVELRMDGAAVLWVHADEVEALLAAPATRGDAAPGTLMLPAAIPDEGRTRGPGAWAIDESSRATARFVVNFARELLPRWVVIENVIQMRAWHGYARLIDDLRVLGYHVEPMVLDARNFGVPQQQRRLFVLCDLERAPPRRVQGTSTGAATVASILDPPGTWPTTPLRHPGRAAPTLERADRAIAALGTGEPFLIVYYGTDASGGWQRIDRPLRTLTTLDRFGLVTWVDGEPRLRMLQVPELKRAMGFGDGYDLAGIGTRRDRIRLLGNGVAPPVMAAVVGALTGDRAWTEHYPVAQHALSAA